MNPSQPVDPFSYRPVPERRALLRLLLTAILLVGLLASCSGGETANEESDAGSTDAAVSPTVPDDLSRGLLVALAAIDKNDDGSPKLLPARLGVVTRKDGLWDYGYLEDSDSNVFHKAMEYGDGILTLGGTAAVVKLWRPNGEKETLWQKDFGGKFSRMRDGEVGDIYGDGTLAIAIATHDRGEVAVLRPHDDGSFEVDLLDSSDDAIIVHEVEIGDLDGDGAMEVYATPSEPNKLDGSHQEGWVVRYVPAAGGERTVVVEMGDRHAKEILVDDVDGDGRDELYVAIEAVSGGEVEIRRYDADTDPAAGQIVATIDDSLTRFLTAGDIDGDGKKEMVAAAKQAGVFLLRSVDGEWQKELIDADSGGFEHAALLTDLDGDGTDELYVASDDHDEINRYVYSGGEWHKELLTLHLDGLGRFTWNLMPVRVELLPEIAHDA